MEDRSKVEPLSLFARSQRSVSRAGESVLDRHPVLVDDHVDKVDGERDEAENNRDPGAAVESDPWSVLVQTAIGVQESNLTRRTIWQTPTHWSAELDES